MKKSIKVPLIIGGAMAGVGVAYAAKSLLHDKESEVARELHIETSIAINKTPAELYAFWHDIRNLPRFMMNLESVTPLENGKSHWVAKGIGGSHVEWDAEIFNEHENELISWRSLGNPDVVNAGTVRFQATPDGQGTNVRVTLNYNPPGGAVGKTILQVFGSEPEQLIREDLKRLKQLLEAGQITGVDGQTSRDSAIPGAAAS